MFFYNVLYAHGPVKVSWINDFVFGGESAFAVGLFQGGAQELELELVYETIIRTRQWE